MATSGQLDAAEPLIQGLGGGASRELADLAEEIGFINERLKTRVLVPVEDLYCLTHAKKRPYERCDGLFSRTETTDFAQVLNQLNGGRAGILAEIRKQLGLGLGPLEKPSGSDPTYDVNKYRHEINTALRGVRRLLKGAATKGLPGQQSNFPDGYKDLIDLKQIVDIEIWKATKHYGAKMNGALAYTIAKNQAGKFLKQQINEQMIELKDDDGNPILDEFDEPVKVYRFDFLDAKGTDDTGDLETTPAENQAAITAAGFVPPNNNNPGQYAHENVKSWASAVILKTLELNRLVNTWYGAKKLVGLAILQNPDVTVRDIPGVPKSTAGRVRKVVLEEFRKVMAELGPS